MSTHQYPFYPGTGDATDVGEGAGEGFTVNVPLTAHGGDGVYRAAFEQVLLPIAEEYAPELVLVSAGFDAAVRDPLAQMEVTADAFGWMARALAEVAAKSAKGRIALVLEGGYDLVSLEAGLAQAIAGNRWRGRPGRRVAAPAHLRARSRITRTCERARRGAAKALGEGRSPRQFRLQGGPRRLWFAALFLVAVAQLVERWIVAPAVAGSKPVGHPKIGKRRLGQRDTPGEPLAAASAP